MKAKAIFSLILVALLALFSLNGCVFDPEDEQSGDVKESIEAIDQNWGGFTTSDEATAFGEDLIENEYPEDETVDDLLETEPELEDDLTNSHVNVYFLRIAWGILAGDSTATEVVNWSGSAQVNKGTLALLRKIRFEGEDEIVRPRPDHRTLEWHSFTQPHFDGLSLVVFDNDTTDTGLEGTLTLMIGQYSRIFTFTELDSIDLIEPVGSAGHEIAIVSRKRAVIPFAGGFLDGRWIRRDSVGGVFHGRWINSIGTRAGHLRGIWGINRIGENVLFGKWIDNNGRFQGLLAGSWGAATDGAGWFEGRWVNRSLVVAGKFNGQWRTAKIGHDRGYLHGRWLKLR